MGFFDRRDDKKKADAFDSPVETIDLDAPPPEPEPPAEPAAQSAPPIAADYGVDQAIQLMRTLPQDNVELVVQVVKHTLESAQIQISHIIDDATHRQQDIEGRVQVLKDEIAELEKEISTRKQEIERLEADHEETTTVRDRLVLAEKLETGGAAQKPGGKASSAKARGAPPASDKTTPKPNKVDAEK